MQNISLNFWELYLSQHSVHQLEFVEFTRGKPIAYEGEFKIGQIDLNLELPFNVNLIRRVL